MARRLSVLLALLVGALFVGIAPASAATYPGTGGTVTVSSSTVSSGGAVTVRGCGFQPGSTVTSTVTNNGQVSNGPSGTAGNDGCVTLNLTLTATGGNLILLSGTGADGGALTVSTTVTVTAPASAGGGLPRTGGDLTALWAGIALLLAGGALVAVTRTRRSHVSA